MSDNRPSSFPPHDPARREDRPTRARWRIVALLAIIAALTYVDRLNFGIAGKYIQDQFAFSTETMGWVLSAFVLGYALFQVPGGWLGDRYGPRAVLTVAILWWSAFTTATAFAPRLPLARWFGLAWSFAIVRFLLGVGEAAAFPNINRTIAFWFGESQRGLANSVFIGGIGAGGVLTPLAITAIMQRWGWRASFYASALAGVGIAFAWRFYAANRPEQHPGVNAQELALIRSRPVARQEDSLPERATVKTSSPPTRATPWGRMLSSPSVWGLILSYFCIAYPAYIFYMWFFIYLVRVRGLSLTQGSFASSAPFVAVVVITPLGGWLSDFAVAKFSRRRGRRIAVWIGAACSAVLLAAGGRTADNAIAILLLSLAAGFNLASTATWWATSNDLTRNFSGSLAGLMNMCGNLGGWLSPILTALIATRLGWTYALDFAALMTLAAGAIWVLVNAEDNLEAAARRN